MPIYDYVCHNCGRREEVLHGLNAAGPEACSACGGSMRKVLSPPAIVFKGSGWAKMDARAGRSSANRDAKDEKPARDDKASASEARPTGEGGSGSAGEAAAASD